MHTTKTYVSQVTRALTLTALVAAAVTAAYAQTTPAPKTPAPDSTTKSEIPADGDDIVNLSVFEVTSKKDSPYIADKSVSTTGFAADLQKIPLSINVVTEKFLLDTGGVGFNGIIDYQANISGDATLIDNGSRTQSNTTAYAEPPKMRVRGQEINTNQRNGMPMSIGFSTENVNRVEIARGPMSVFIGGSTIGGVINLISNKPLFKWQHTVTASVDSNASVSARLDSTGPLIPKKLAYRVIAQYDDDNTWRDYSNSTLKFLNPQILWRPFERLTLRAEYAYRRREGNSVSFAQKATQQYQNDFDNPSQALLDVGKIVQTGANAGKAFTVEQYRKRIGRDWMTWRADNFRAYGKWVTLGDHEGFAAGDWPDGIKTNHFGPNAPYTANYDLAEAEVNMIATDWLELRALGRWTDSNADSYLYGNPLRRYPDGSTPYNMDSSNTRWERPINGKIEAVITKKLLYINHHLLGGYEATKSEARSVSSSGAWDYTKLPSVPGSLNVFNSPAILVGKDVINYFDPRVHALPDISLARRLQTDVYPPGTASQAYTRKYTEAAYAGYSGGIWNDRITLFAGYRNGIIESKTWSEDCLGTRLAMTGVTPRQSSQSWTVGIVIEPVPGINIYASRNTGNDAQGGSLINPVAPADIPLVPAAEQNAHPVPDLEGEGKEIGIKIEMFKRKLIGRIGYFDLYKRNTIVRDGDRSTNDPRNIGTMIDPNPATQDLTKQPHVQWNMTLDGNRSEGIEISITGQPIKNYTILFEASHLYKNQITLSEPANTQNVVTNTAYGEYLIMNGRPLANTPNNTLKVWQKYAITQGRLDTLWFGFGIKAQSNFMPSVSPASWGSVLPGYTVFDFATGYSLKFRNNPVALQLNVSNITDKLYSAGGNSYSPPRTIMFQATLAL